MVVWSNGMLLDTFRNKQDKTGRQKVTPFNGPIIQFLAHLFIQCPRKTKVVFYQFGTKKLPAKFIG